MEQQIQQQGHLKGDLQQGDEKNTNQLPKLTKVNLMKEAVKTFDNIIPYDLEIDPRQKLPEIARAADDYSITTPTTATATTASAWDTSNPKEPRFADNPQHLPALHIHPPSPPVNLLEQSVIYKDSISESVSKSDKEYTEGEQGSESMQIAPKLIDVTESGTAFDGSFSSSSRASAQVLKCHWSKCTAGEFSDKRDLILHLNDHAEKLEWKIKNHSYSYGCLWDQCWNKTAFVNPAKMMEHLRAHTLEKPFICPVKSCKMSFAIKSNCLAHSKSRHNRSVKPIFFDIVKNELIIDDSPVNSGEGEDDGQEEEIVINTQRKRKQIQTFNPCPPPNVESAAKRQRSARTTNASTEKESFQKAVSSKKSEYYQYEDNDYLAQLERYESWLEYTSREMQACKDRLRLLLEVLVANQPDPVSSETTGFEKEFGDLRSHLDASRGALEETKSIINSLG